MTLMPPAPPSTMMAAVGAMNVRLMRADAIDENSASSGAMATSGSGANKHLCALNRRLSTFNQFLHNRRRRMNQSLSQRSARDPANHEARIARTILIVVGCFVFCWVPFTIVYMLQIGDTCRIETGCMPTAVFAVCFWLGYANSSINPII